MYAIMQSGGKQYTVKAGDFVELEKLEGEVGAEVVFDTVLAVGEEGGKLNIGTPVVAGATVTATVEKNGRGKKIYVLKYKSKKNEKKKIGHRQAYTKVTIKSINA